MTQKPFVTELTHKQITELKKVLEEQGCRFNTPPYTHYCAKKEGLSVTAYTSGKVTVQGKKAPDFVEFVLEPNILKSLRFTAKVTDRQERIGSDESGKGDVFGPLVISCCFAKASDIDYLDSLGVMDSKKLNDKKILALEKKITDVLPYETVLLTPEKYNELYSKILNLNELLAWGHAAAIDTLLHKTKAPLAIVDQFANKQVLQRALAKKNITIDVEQRVRAEEDPVVAAASIIARAAFVRFMESMERRWGIAIPKGASTPTHHAIRQFCQKYGKEKLPLIAKMHFKTVGSIVESIT